MSAEQSWARIEGWLAEHAPNEEPLPGPCTEAELERLYERIGVRLPPDVEESLLRHDGSGLITVIPLGWTLHSCDKIAERYAEWARDARRFDPKAGPFVPVGEIGGNLQLLTDPRTGRIGEWDRVQGHSWDEDPLWSSFAGVLEFTGSVLASTRPWIAMLPGDEEWEATDQDPDFPGTLSWTEDLQQEVEWDMRRLNREYGFADDR
ncbi:SMI1/KNR4 family protein [Streptomyces alfalfae]|uniref:SMI1/KNR4 family protein n=1 Tax=Streptomyces alfalfae TaxID=1642299 RepID=A0A7T4U1G4_9ACTN|nr:SMI1/KNR4 family protein [Streptomyces alfalfae]QQC93375.1 SMI1/KNR4 family protein [Streptomyces alfalfae]